MTAAKDGDKVKVHYTGALEDGTVFDSSQEAEPLEFIIGSGALIPGFENAVRGMKTGESRTVKIEPDDAYGQHFAEMVQTVPVSAFDGNVKPEVGQQFEVSPDDNEPFIVTVTGLEDGNVTLDANHPLAGKALVFEISLVAIA
jgi:peptidylprolyl isomerase